jgi:hypothetical protein
MTVFRDLAASDNDAGVNKNIDFAIVAGNADIVSYVCSPLSPMKKWPFLESDY